jgi:hypothetical protein
MAAAERARPGGQRSDHAATGARLSLPEVAYACDCACCQGGDYSHSPQPTAHSPQPTAELGMISHDEREAPYTTTTIHCVRAVGGWSHTPGV